MTVNFGTFRNSRPLSSTELKTSKGTHMKTIAISLAIGASALFASAASAAPHSNGFSILPDNGVENVRLVCDQRGRCVRTRAGQRVVIQRDYDSYNYAPREGYIERRGYDDGGYYNRGPGVGIDVGPGGVGVGFGRW
jgi:hypothetical protein